MFQVKRIRGIPAIVLAMMIFFSIGCQSRVQKGGEKSTIDIVTADTLLSGMVLSLLPPGRANVTAIMPPGQCPGHYDIKLSDIRKVKSADLVVSVRGRPFMEKAETDSGKLLLLDEQDRNWMAPDSYIFGLNLLAAELSVRFPKEKQQIATLRKKTIDDITNRARVLSEKIKQAGISGMPILASSLQAEPLEWMGFHVVGKYGRPEAMSAKDIVRLSQIGRDSKAVMVVDNLQSGPDAGKGIAETLGVQHVILSNFPSEKGYAATLRANVDAVLAAVKTRG